MLDEPRHRAARPGILAERDELVVVDRRAARPRWSSRAGRRRPRHRCPASTRARSPRLGDRAELRSGSSVSSETLTAASPAARSGTASSASRWPFVVITTCSMPGDARDRGERARRCPWRTVGSPPVSRILRTPSRANTRHDPLDLLERQHRRARLRTSMRSPSSPACSTSNGSCSGPSPRSRR